MDASSPGNASEDTREVQALNTVVSDCQDTQVVQVMELPRLVSQGLWESVGKVLGTDVSDSQRKHAVEQAAERAEYKALVCFILPQCSDSEMDTVMTRCLSRSLWEPAYLGLNSDDAHFDQDVLDGVCKDLPKPFTLTQLRVNVRVRASLYRHRVRQTVVKEVEEASRTAEEPYFIRYVLPHCKNQQVNTVLTNLVARDMWQSVSNLLKKKKHWEKEKHFQWAVKESVRKASDQDLDDYILSLFKKASDFEYEHVAGVFASKQLVSFLLSWLAEFERWSVMSRFICQAITDAILFWFDVDAVTNDEMLWLILTSLNTVSTAISSACLSKELIKIVESLGKDLYCSIIINFTEEECDMVFKAVAIVLYCFVCGTREHVLQLVAGFSGDFSDSAAKRKHGLLKYIAHQTEHKLSTVQTDRDRGDAMLMVFNALWCVLTSRCPLTARVIGHILNIHTWDTLSSTCLWHFGEPTRRHMFQLAVKEKQWKIVKQWADHTLYDDQRWWALDEAYKEKQWDVMLRLADHGLAALEATKVTNRLIRSADWGIFLDMLERGVDIAEIKATLLQTLSKNKQRGIPSPEGLEKALGNVLTLEDKLKDLKFEVEGADALKTRDWRRVFYFAQRSRAGPSYKLRALKAAIKSKAWHVVIPLIRLGIDPAKHDSLFTGMMKRRQWGVCSALLDLGVSLQVCLYFLSELMEMNQWTLVARVMEFNVGETVRQQVMRRAMERREGSVVWRCISTMDHYRLSLEERQTLFQQAFSHGDWQTIKPLVETRDATGIRHRDKAMLDAIDQHQWDVVDYCQLFGANINVKDELGETPLNRAGKLKLIDHSTENDSDEDNLYCDDVNNSEAERDEELHTDWEAVEELVVRDADPNILDCKGYSVLNIAIQCRRWEIVKLLIEYLGDIHKTATCRDLGPSSLKRKRAQRDFSTPLQLLIEDRQSEVIQHTLMWCPDLWNGVTRRGETTLHALCKSSSHCENSLYYQVRRGVNPLALTEDGQSALYYAVKSQENAQKMVAESIKLGFSTHQPYLTDTFGDVRLLLGRELRAEPIEYFWSSETQFTSPLLRAMLDGLPVVMQMLYESGASSNNELFILYLASTVSHVQWYGDTLLDSINNWNALLPTLERMAMTPRSLMSSCRLVISFCLDPNRRRHKDVGDLDILSPKMKDYVMFTDLTHPDYGKEGNTPRLDYMPKLLETIKQMDEEEKKDRKTKAKLTRE